ncbi:MAG: glycosyltransferase family 2 protein [Thermoanaerobaculia bacterium]|nr:glycosyltransferase family 2 protein [Thermoanaerobaculia bacterium]
MNPPAKIESRGRICVVMPAYNAARTLARTVADLPAEWVDDLVLVDDASADRTVEVAHGLGLYTVVHPENRGYGANQKTCYREALARGADICVMVHPDHQYDPAAVAELVAPLVAGRCDAVFGSRILGGQALAGGMPRWKYVANRLLTALANRTFGVHLTEYHSGLRAYSRRYLEAVDLAANADGFVFDSEIIAQGLWLGLRIEEIPIATRYFPEASQIGFWASVRYGFGVLGVLARYRLHRHGVRGTRILGRPPYNAGYDPLADAP